MLKGKTVLVGVSSSIAIFKACELVSQLRQRGATVHVLMTQNATKLVTPLTFHALSGNPVIVDLFEPKEHSIQHVALADQADAFVIAPATANIIAKLANGIADDAVSTTALACRAPLIIAPAMETKMWEHPATQRNIQTLQERGAVIVEPEEGWLSSGKKGKGRLASIDKIIAAVEMALGMKRDLEGWKVLVTSGATREPIDRVRFISNPSSGKMGFAIAQVAKERGADVILVAGHTEVSPPEGIEVVKVKTAREMIEAVMKYAGWFDVLVSAAAIADFTPKQTVEGKIGRGETETLVLELEPTPDLLATVRQRCPTVFLVGFAAEVGEPTQRAIEKLRRKGLNLIVANDVSQPDSGFGVDTNRCIFISADGSIEPLPLLTKREVAERLWDKIKELRNRV
ncbi:MAG: bifunctional phosphopantothenoylcysteine decarboxylase/phosphopantothenate--cysteine ligase CoaBC [Armatimonadetes bacterium]|nr:bifunctional phosphopantothenoylcysteine decarboxylase/phosphopantothenate--cysteine ligase CoaBC [Armatimonadota bacterium]MCX7968994.1 bifunctional phosphopantothenoylcysteine decarboxylase/phosphopantothenate--cysteine ligase CoaBC [Armatimonadota bacterium]MDW8142981.1 bifunctional phosphopantothenoylcysteine decarboxylase/phosphopantothenate--cysteine ligase CoaBC [Armatimonadota bacterium]